VRLIAVIVSTVILLTFLTTGCTSSSTSTPASTQTATTEPTITPRPIATIKTTDFSEMKIYDWTFLYRWADHADAPPEGFTWNADHEETNEFLFLKNVSDGTKLKISSSEIAKFEWTWEESETMHGWLEITSFTIIKNNGEIIVVQESLPNVYYIIDMSELTEKEWAQKHTAYSYIYGITYDDENYSHMIKFPLFSLFSSSYENEDFPIPEEILFGSE
jgi:hypothetical protein